MNNPKLSSRSLLKCSAVVFSLLMFCLSAVPDVEAQRRGGWGGYRPAPTYRPPVYRPPLRPRTPMQPRMRTPQAPKMRTPKQAAPRTGPNRSPSVVKKSPSIRQNAPVAGLKGYKGRVTKTGKPVVTYKSKNYQIPQRGISKSLNAQRLANAKRLAEQKRWDEKRRQAAKKRLAALAAGTTAAKKKDETDGGDTLVALGSLQRGGGGNSGGSGGKGGGSGRSGNRNDGEGLKEKFNRASRESASGLKNLFANGQKPRASEVRAWAEAQGWTKKQTPNGPLKYVDEKGIERIIIKQGSPRTPGSEEPHVEIRNAYGDRVDPFGNPVNKKSKGNHTPIEWD